MPLRLLFEADDPHFYDISATLPTDELQTFDKKETQSPLFKTLKALYFKTAQSFLSSLPSDPFSGETITPKYPSYFIEDEENQVHLDGDLFEQLCDLYILYGWKGILETEKLLRSKLPAAEPESGGVNDPPDPSLLASYRFFNLTQKILSILIRESLCLIERKAAESIISSLSVSSVNITKALTHYGLHKIKKMGTGQRKKRVVSEPYRMSNVKASNRLYLLLKEAVLKRKKIEDYFSQLSSGKKKKEQLSSSNVTMQASDARETAESNVQLENKIQHESIQLNNLLSKIKSDDPLVLTVFPGLSQTFSQAAFENNTGQLFISLLRGLDKIGNSVDPPVSNVRAQILWPAEKTFGAMEFVIPEEGVERAMVKKAFQNNFYALLNPGVLRSLVNSEKIATDSFEYVVLFHYSNELSEQLQNASEQEKKNMELWDNISKITAAVSIASLFLPVLGLVTGGLMKLFDLALIFNTIYSARSTMLSFDQQIIDKLLDTVPENSDHTQAIADIGELINSRKEYRESLAKEISIELVMIMARTSVGKKSLIRKAFEYRNYYNDIKTVYE